MQTIREQSMHREEQWYSDKFIQFDSLLREKSGGNMEGLPLAAFKKASKEANMEIRDFSAPEGERWKDVNIRAKKFLHEDIMTYLG